MSASYLVKVSAVMVALAVIGLLAFGAMRGALPPEPPRSGWPTYRVGSSTPLSLDEQRAAVQPYRGLETSALTGWLVSSSTAAELRAASQTVATGDQRVIEKFGDLLRDAQRSASTHAALSMFLFLLLAVAGVTGFVRLRKPGATVFGGAGLVVGVLIGTAGFLLNGVPALWLLVCLPLLLAFFAQLVATNLLPGKTHGFVKQEEDRLRGMSGPEQGAYIARRLLIGAVLSGGGLVVAVVLALALKQLGAGLTVVPMGAIVFGLVQMTAPSVAALRLKVKSH